MKGPDDLLNHLIMNNPEILMKYTVNKNTQANKKKTSARGRGREASHVKHELKDFDFHSCAAWIEIQNRFSTGIRHTELLSIAKVLCLICKDLPPVGRSCCRSFPVLIKWFSENWEVIRPELSCISILDEEQKPITGLREMKELAGF